jgi:hypothetical protein
MDKNNNKIMNNIKENSLRYLLMLLMIVNIDK